MSPRKKEKKDETKQCIRLPNFINDYFHTRGPDEDLDPEGSLRRRNVNVFKDNNDKVQQRFGPFNK